MIIKFGNLGDEDKLALESVILIYWVISKITFINLFKVTDRGHCKIL